MTCQNIKTILFVILASLFMFSCEINVFFDDAMPPDVEPISEIPDYFQGIFICESDSSIIHSTGDIVLKESYNRFVTTLDRIRESENCSVLAGGIHLGNRNECFPFTYITEDSIAVEIYSIDTIFHFNDEQVAKIYKDRLFLNIGDQNEGWITFMITPQPDGDLLWEYIDVPDKLKSIEKITYNYKTIERPEKDNQYILKPTLVEFDRILQNRYTTQCDYLRRVNLETENYAH